MLILILFTCLTAYSCFKGEGGGGANWANYDIVYKWSIGWAHTHIEGEAHKGGYNNVLFIQRFPGKHRRLLLFVTKKYFYSLQNSLEALKIFFIICCSGGPLARMHICMATTNKGSTQYSSQHIYDGNLLYEIHHI